MMSGDRNYNKENICCYVIEGGRVIPGVSISTTVSLLFGRRKSIEVEHDISMREVYGLAKTLY